MIKKFHVIGLLFLMIMQSTEVAKKYVEVSTFTNLPNHIELDKEKLVGKVKAIVSREEVNLNINDLLIIEFYSRK